MEPRVEYGTLSDEDIAIIGLDAAEAAFLHDVEAGLTNGDSLILVVGTVGNTASTWQELGRRGIGPNFEKFVGYVDPITGKLAMVLMRGENSDQVYEEFGDRVPEGPQRWTGGVYYAQSVQTVDEGWTGRNFAGAASGVQGYFDAATVYTALTRMGAAWALKMQALHGKPA